MRATIKDIALRAGVSKTTVSFALNNPSRISKETYERIMAIVRELGYYPNPLARTLTTKRLGALGLLLPQPIAEVMGNPHLCEIISGIGKECDSHRISLTMLPPVQGKVIEAARRSFVDAIVTIGVGPEHEVVNFFHKHNIPFVTIDGQETEDTINVGIDDESAAFALMNHILELGHKHIAILCVRRDFKSISDINASIVLEKRLKGFSRALEAYSLGLSHEGITVLETEGSLEGGKRAGLAVLKSAERPTAIVAMADIIALGTYAAAQDLGIVIPEQLSVAGFDDIPQGSYAHPTLTTIHQPSTEKGQVAASMALQLLDGKKVEHRRFSFRLEVKGSTARVP